MVDISMAGRHHSRGTFPPLRYVFRYSKIFNLVLAKLVAVGINLAYHLT